MTYEQAYKDHCYLWGIGGAQDMTGAYVDSEDLEKLLKSPTKKTAKDCLCRQIKFWFEIGPDVMSGTSDPQHWIETDERVADIAERHRVTL